MKTKKRLLTGIMIAVAACGGMFAGGCGGGGGAVGGLSGDTAPAAGVSAGGGSGAGMGQVSVKAVFPDLSAGRVEAGKEAETTTGIVTVSITVTGYSLNGKQPFAPVTSVTQVSLSAGAGKAKVLAVPVGKNHLITATADWGYASATVKGLITEVSNGAVKQAIIDSRTTAIADAVVKYSQDLNSILPDLDAAALPKFEQAVDDLSAAGVPYTSMTDASVIDYMEYKPAITSASVTISPATASVVAGGQQAFTAVVYDTANATITSAIITWSASPASMGSITSAGVFTAGASAAGTATITASYGAITATRDVTVTSSAPAAAVCGNSSVEAGETCDSGASNTNTPCSAAYGATCSYCSASCQTVTVTGASCGDSTVNGTETCDSGASNTNTPCSAAYGGTCNYCNTSCQTQTVTGATCGDGAVNGIEVCDSGASNGQPNFCNSTCNGTVPAVCGNSIVESGETCDDGNTATETCAYGQSSCTICNATCQSAAGALTGYCGDSVIQTGNGEVCDDGNAISGDGCSAACQNDAIDTNAWISIPAGDFVMGCAAADTGCGADESPKRTVTLSAFKIQKYEVTNAQYAACVAASACAAPSSSNSYSRTPYYGNATYNDYPVIFVDWNKAAAYCAWIGGRLPTEAEWEKAARGPSPREPIYPWGDTSPTCALAAYNFTSCSLGDIAMGGTHTTGASYYGALDMTGNNWEWTNDWYGSTYYASAPSTDPFGPVSGTYRVLRGGSWQDNATLQSASHRNGVIVPAGSYDRVGFRCAKDGPVIPVCGNSAVESGETCDDGNTTTESCAYGQSSCTVCNSTCQSAAGAVTGYCGDSTTQAGNGEGCDDGNATTESCAYGQSSCTVCNSTCQSAAGAVTGYCGDSATQAGNGEGCDDGNTTTESCVYGQSSCTVCNSTCQSAAGAVTGYCGDAATQGGNGETCDAGGSNTNTPCSAAYGGTCNYCNTSCASQTVTGPSCGDGILQSGNGEACDDANATSLDGCSSTCQFETFVKVDAGRDFACGLLSSGAVACWGANNNSQTGDGTYVDHSRPKPVQTLSSGVVDIEVGGISACALMNTGGVKCWGSSQMGVLGNNYGWAGIGVPMDVVGLTSGVAAISMMGYSPCALLTNGEVKCWGFDYYGSLGDGANVDQPAPVSVQGYGPGQATATAIMTGYYHACAMGATATRCWGMNGSWQLGTGGSTNSNVPVDLVGYTPGPTAMTGMWASTCFLTAAGGIDCLGDGGYGQLGNGGGSSPTLVSVTGLGAAATIMDGDASHMCAVLSGGGLKCWGQNTEGRVGDGTTTNRNTATQVAGYTSGIVDVAAGYDFSCAVLSTGRITCWGNNAYGQLGNGTTTASLTPVTVGGY